VTIGEKSEAYFRDGARDLAELLPTSTSRPYPVRTMPPSGWHPNLSPLRPAVFSRPHEAADVGPCQVEHNRAATGPLLGRIYVIPHRKPGPARSTTALQRQAAVP
jgi:hypothetical protein